MVAAAAGAGCFMFFNFCVIDVLKILFLVSETIRAAFVLCDSGRREIMEIMISMNVHSTTLVGS